MGACKMLKRVVFTIAHRGKGESRHLSFPHIVVMHYDMHTPADQI
jgi:hypothetical protein